MSEIELQQLLRELRNCKTLFVGIGSEIRGDELGIKRIIENLSKTKNINMGALWTDTRPENFLKYIEEYNPEKLIFLQASKFGGSAGDIRVLYIAEHDEDTLHESPITTMAHYLDETVGTKSILVVVEPKYLKIGGISDEMKKAADRISTIILDYIQRC